MDQVVGVVADEVVLPVVHLVGFDVPEIAGVVQSAMEHVDDDATALRGFVGGQLHQIEGQVRILDANSFVRSFRGRSIEVLRK